MDDEKCFHSDVIKKYGSNFDNGLNEEIGGLFGKITAEEMFFVYLAVHRMYDDLMMYEELDESHRFMLDKYVQIAAKINGVLGKRGIDIKNLDEEINEEVIRFY